MRTSTIIVAIVAATSVHASYAADSYLCIADKSVGFSMNEKTKDWHDTTFEPDHRYIIKKLMTGKIKWEITAFGSSKTFAACGNDFDEDGLLDCVGRVTEGTFEFHLNKITLRFLGTHSDGYWDYNVTQRYSGAAEGSVTPMMEIGRCSRI